MRILAQVHIGRHSATLKYAQSRGRTVTGSKPRPSHRGPRPSLLSPGPHNQSLKFCGWHLRHISVIPSSPLALPTQQLHSVNWVSCNNLTPSFSRSPLIQCCQVDFPQATCWLWLYPTEKKKLLIVFILGSRSPWTCSNITSPLYFLLTSFNMNEAFLPKGLNDVPFPDAL